MKFAPAIFSSLAAVSSVAAHGSFQQLWVNGVDQTDTCANKVSGNSPLWNVATSSIACNLYSTASAKCTVPAGATVDVEMHQQYNDRDCANAAIGGNHDGPVLVYMAKVDDALSANPNTANWFKVAELGLIKTDYWGTDSLNANCGRLAFKVPECIPSGDYLIKAEVIALHTALLLGAQFYTTCYSITVSGGGSTLPTDTVKFPGAYSETDPGILFNLYDGVYTSYPAPGPPVWSCSAASVSTKRTYEQL